MAKEKWFLTCISNAIIKCKSLTRKGEKYERAHTCHMQDTDKSHSNMNNKKQNEIK